MSSQEYRKDHRNTVNKLMDDRSQSRWSCFDGFMVEMLKEEVQYDGLGLSILGN